MTIGLHQCKIDNIRYHELTQAIANKDKDIQFSFDMSQEGSFTGFVDNNGFDGYITSTLFNRREVVIKVSSHFSINFDDEPSIDDFSNSLFIECWGVKVEKFWVRSFVGRGYDLLYSDDCDLKMPTGFCPDNRTDVDFASESMHREVHRVTLSVLEQIAVLTEEFLLAQSSLDFLYNISECEV